MVKKTRKPSRRLVVIIVALIALIGITVFGAYSYIKWQNREVYSSNETISFNGFQVRLVDYSLIDKSGLPSEAVLLDGAIESPEDCNKYPDIVVPLRGGESSFTSPSAQKYTCQNTNQKIEIYNKYEPSYKKLALNLEIKTNKDTSINVSDLKTYINVPSGRDITKKFEYAESDYTPYGVSSKGGYLHNELTRTINMWSDIKDDEKLVDIVLKYNNQQRIYRLRF